MNNNTHDNTEQDAREIARTLQIVFHILRNRVIDLNIKFPGSKIGDISEKYFIESKPEIETIRNLTKKYPSHVIDSACSWLLHDADERFRCEMRDKKFAAIANALQDGLRKADAEKYEHRLHAAVYENVYAVHKYIFIPDVANMFIERVRISVNREHSIFAFGDDYIEQFNILYGDVSHKIIYCVEKNGIEHKIDEEGNLNVSSRDWDKFAEIIPPLIDGELLEAACRA